MSTRRHPLDPLSTEEMARVSDVLRAQRDVDDRWRYGSVLLVEPSKAALRGWADGEGVAREALATVWSRDDGVVHEAVVDLDAGTVTSWVDRPGVQANFTRDEYHECDEMLRAHPAVIQALRTRGIEDLDLVLFDLWAAGADGVPETYRDLRFGWCDVWLRRDHDSNPYARFVEGIQPLVDVNAMTLLDINDSGVFPLPDTMGEYVPRHVPGLELRDDVKALDVIQPDGPSFTLDGHELRWQKWSMRVGFNLREGLTIHTLGYEDDGRVRPVAHRLSFAEMVVPYRDTAPAHRRRTAFDIGEWGMGAMTVPLTLGCDCLGEISYLDAVIHDSHGRPETIPNAICIHEEDDSVLWKHVDPRSGSEVRRMRRLVVSFHATVANYEYLVYWSFYQDGSLDCEVRATGIMVTSRHDGDGSPYGTVVDHGVYAPFHQHFLVARLDLDVDGEENTVVETHSEAPPIGPENPHGMAVIQRSTPLLTEAAGVQDYDWPSQRAWKVTNPNRLNAHGQPVAYKLAPTGCLPALLDPSSPVIARAGAIAHQLWVTPFADDERWPCGDYPTQSGSDAGLPAWTAADRPIENTDVVLWFVFGIHHVTRVEDWPIMPADVVSFELKPVGFFDRSPVLDVPPSPSDHCAS